MYIDLHTKQAALQTDLNKLAIDITNLRVRLDNLPPL